MIRFLLLTAAALAMMAPNSSYADCPDWTAEASGPFEYNPNHNGHPNFFGALAIANRVYVYFRHNVDDDTGQGWHEVHLTNGVRHRGFTTIIETTYSGPGVNITARYVLGVNPRGERRERRDITMTPEAWSRVTTYHSRAGWCPSNRIGEAVVGAVEEAVRWVGEATVLGGGNQESQPVENNGSPQPTSVEVFSASAIVPCRRPGSTGSVTIHMTARASCEEALSRVASEVNSGGACRRYAADAVLNGSPNFSQGCGRQMVPLAEAN